MIYSAMSDDHTTPLRHVIAALVTNEPGVLANVAGMFAARGFNIDSLVVGRTENPELSRMTIVVTGGGGKDAAQALLGKACYEGDLGAVKRAVAAGADPNKRAHKYDTGAMGGTDTAVIVAARKGKLRVLRFLLAAAGADPNIYAGRTSWSSSGKFTPCYAACCYHHHDCVHVLLALSAAPDQSRFTRA